MLPSLFKAKSSLSNALKSYVPKSHTFRYNLRKPKFYSTQLNEFEIQTRLLNVLKKLDHVDVAKVTPTANLFKDLDFDSLSAMELLVLLEDEFVIDIKEDDAAKLVSCDSIVDYISKNPLAK